MQPHPSSKSSGSDDQQLIRPTKFEPVKGLIKQHKPRLHKRSIAVVIGLLISAGLAWYIVTGKSVYFEVIPATADMDISGGIKLKLADRYLLREGNYQIHLNAEGYHTLVTDLQITDERSQEYQLQMRPLPGHLKIMTEPATNAQIWVNNIDRGLTPSTVSGLEPGTYIIRLTSDRFFDDETEMTIEGMDKEQFLTLMR